MKSVMFLCFFLLSLVSCGTGGGKEDDTQISQPSTTTCGDITVNACNADSHDDNSEVAEASDEFSDDSSSDDGELLGSDLQDGALRQAPPVAAKIAELEAQGQHVFKVWRLSAKDCNVNVGVCGGSVVNDNDTQTTNVGDGDGTHIE